MERGNLVEVGEYAELNAMTGRLQALAIEPDRPAADCPCDGPWTLTCDSGVLTEETLQTNLCRLSEGMCAHATCSTLTALDVSGIAFPTEAFEHVAALHALRSICMDDAKLGNGRTGKLPVLAGLCDLAYISLQGNALTDDAVPHVEQLVCSTSSAVVVDLRRNGLTGRAWHTLLGQMCSRLQTRRGKA